MADQSSTCRECRNDIIQGARKCSVCNAYQDWRRYMLFGNTTLTLLVALISVLATGLPSIVDLFAPISEDVRAYLTGNKQRLHQEFHAINYGNSPSMIHDVATLKYGKSDSEKFNIKLEIPGESTYSFVVLPGVSVRYTFYLDNDQKDILSGDLETCVLHFKVTDVRTNLPVQKTTICPNNWQLR